MFTCSNCGKQTTKAMASHDLKLLCLECSNSNTVYPYDTYDPTTNSMIPPKCNETQLIDFVHSFFGLHGGITSGMIVQIKRSKFTYLEIKRALIFYHCIQRNPIKTQSIGIVPYVINQSNAHYAQVSQQTYRKMQKIRSEATIKQQQKIVKVEVQENSKKDEVQLFDLEALFGGLND